MLSKKQALVLGLSAQENRILGILEQDGELSIQDISKKGRLPRTTVYWPLQQLLKRGFVDYSLVGKRKRWRVAKNSPESLLMADKQDRTVPNIVEGVPAMRALYNKALDLYPTERILVLEGSTAIHSVAQKGGIEFMLRWHTRAHEKKVIVESIISEKTYLQLEKKLINAKIVKSLARWKTWIGYVVPNDWIDVDAALVLFRGKAILADWSKEQAILIDTPEIVELLKNFCIVYKTVGKKVDIVKHVRSIASISR